MEETFQWFANNVFVRLGSNGCRVAVQYRTSETTFFSCLGSTFRPRALLLSPSELLIQNRCVFCMQFRRRRSEKICWTHWAVAPPGAERRWAAAKPLKVGSLPPKIRFSPHSTPLLRRRLSPSILSTSD